MKIIEIIKLIGVWGWVFIGIAIILIIISVILELKYNKEKELWRKSVDKRLEKLIKKDNR